jgi:RNA recognition motif-containing protein
LLFKYHNFTNCKIEQEPEGELIFFKVPSEESTLFVANIPPEIEEEELEEIFGKYGILHEVHSFEVDNPTIPSKSNFLVNELD